MKKTAGRAAVLLQIDIRKFAFEGKCAFKMSCETFKRIKPVDQLVEALVANLPAERAQGKPTAAPDIVLGSVPMQVLPGPSTTAASSATAAFETEATAAFHKQRDEYARIDEAARAPAPARKKRKRDAPAEPGAAPKKKKKSRKQSAPPPPHVAPPEEEEAPRMQPQRSIEPGGREHPRTEETQGPRRSKRAKATRPDSLGEYSRPEVP
mmetsp:Transcript_14041/g.48716  ORF Transcript_14041/g.48716 Transcript_14041/m.48716 type:complete len:209 (+) Transcript_14041:330-956(+)